MRSGGERARLATQRTALVLYTFLVLLPALVFGGLLWHQLAADHAEQLDEIPQDVQDAARRLVAGIAERLESLIDAESEREFYHYHQDFWEESTAIGEDGRPTYTTIPSPLAVMTRPAGIVGWFSWDFGHAEDKEPLLLTGAPPALSPEATQERRTAIFETEVQTRLALEEFVDEKLVKYYSHEPIAATFEEWRLTEEVYPRRVPIELLALNLNPRRDFSCLPRDLDALDESVGDLRWLNVRTGPFELQALRDQQGKLRVVALRKVSIERLPPMIVPPECFENLGQDIWLAQGFEVDADWLLYELPTSEARQILGGMRFIPPGVPPATDDPDEHVASFDLFEELEVEVQEPGDEGVAHMHVAVNSRELKANFRVQLAWLSGVGVVMIASLTIGIRLLVGSVKAFQDRARRNENFIAAVTHELRTPIATVKMYGEMLQDGWVKDEDRRRDYLARIVRESDRLGTLVDRVLQKRQLSGKPPRPEPGDLNLAVSNAMPMLRLVDGEERDDVAFDLEPGLPRVLLVPDAVREVLVNLVENARKYAPVGTGATAEPIRAVTRSDGKGRVLLEVLDRGPGIPEHERRRIFDAFYRIGDEKTRRSVGTGLGLHLVDMHVRAMRGRVQALPRPGGGTIFRVTFRTARSGR